MLLAAWALGALGPAELFGLTRGLLMGVAASIIALLYLPGRFEGYSRQVFAYDAIFAPALVIGARVALGAVAPTVRLVKEAAKAIIGTKLDEAALEKLGKAASAACSPIDDKRDTVEFRTKVAAVLAKRAAQIAYKRAGGK